MSTEGLVLLALQAIIGIFVGLGTKYTSSVRQDVSSIRDENKRTNDRILTLTGRVDNLKENADYFRGVTDSRLLRVSENTSDLKAVVGRLDSTIQNCQHCPPSHQRESERLP